MNEFEPLIGTWATEATHPLFDGVFGFIHLQELSVSE